MTRSQTRLAMLAVAIVTALALVLTGCFHGEDSPEDILNETFGNDTQVASGVIDASFELTVEGQGGGTLTAEMSGPFQGDSEDPTVFPQLDLSASANGQFGPDELDFQGGLIATPDQAFVQYQNQAYEVPERLFSSFRQTYQQQAEASEEAGDDSSATTAIFDQLGVDPSSWLTNVSDEGTVDVEGTPTTHIHGDADVEQILADVGTIAQATPAAAAGIDPEQLELVTGLLDQVVQEASVDVYSGEDDRLLRRLEANIALDLSALSEGEVGAITFGFSLTLSGVNEDQAIAAPTDARPLNELLREAGIDLKDLQALPTGDLGLNGASGGAPAAPDDASIQAYEDYLKCLEGASDAEAINACGETLPPPE